MNTFGLKTTLVSGAVALGLLGCGGSGGDAQEGGAAASEGQLAGTAATGLALADTEALLEALAQLEAAGNSLFVVEHPLEVIRRADWSGGVGPQAGGEGDPRLGPGGQHRRRQVRQRHRDGRDRRRGQLHGDRH